MKSKEEIIREIETPLVMKAKFITHIVLEGTDGVGKTTMLLNLLKAYNYRYIVYDRGELSNMVFSHLYGREFVSLQRNLPFLHVLLTANKKEITERIVRRGKEESWLTSEIVEELSKVDYQDLFIKYAEEMKNDFHIITVDISGLNEEDATNKVVREINTYVSSLPTDEQETDWNVSYRLAYEKLGKKFEVRANQPYVDGELMMSESTWQNGNYEKFTDKRFPDNLVYSLSYSKDCYKTDIENKTFDFAYVINSKINRRHEVIDYYLAMAKAKKTCIVSEKVAKALNSKYFTPMIRAFKDDFIREISKAKATVYCARDLAYLRLQTCRLYEGIIANQIVFVDKLSDPDNEMLTQIHSDKDIIDLLYVTPETICTNYNKIINNPSLYNQILSEQSQWYKELKEMVLNYED